ncbi:MAG: D-alanyl-D-alanine carboxypeptidase [Clostridiales bacterium]|nr:D-alanyl-D-alanine carboxypeptidase [Clostridiales bacterium]
MKRNLAALLAALFLWSVCPAARAEGDNNAELVDVSAKSVLLMERETGTVLYASNEHEALEPASVTKIMTMLLVTEALESGTLREEELVTTSEYAAGMGGSQVYLKEGEQMTVRDLLKAVAVASGNDAAVALAEHLAGSESAFVERMNQRAAELGMEDTHFCNCNGLPAEGHLTSAYDIALMSRELLSHDLIRDYVGIWMDSIRDGEFELANTNKLIYYYEGATGLKTGSTNSAGYCISASAQRDGMELIAVVLGSDTSALRFASARALLNYGFGGYTLVDATPEGQLIRVPVSLGEQESVSTRLDGSCKILVAKGDEDKVSAQLEAVDKAAAPLSAGDRLGTLTITVDGETRQTVDLVAGEDVSRLTCGGIFTRLWEKMAMQAD